MWLPAVADRRFVGKGQIARTYNLPPPTGGLNARDAFTDMEPDDAVNMTNVFPEANYCVVRGGFARSTTGLHAPIRTLMTWNGLTGVDQLYAAAGSMIWDGSPGVGSGVVSGLTSVDLQWTCLQNAGGMFLIYVNGVDPPGSYDGSTWGNPAITGATIEDFVNVAQFKERVWFCSVNSLDLHYLAFQAIAGPASVFPLGSVFRRGGYVMAMGSFSNDAGDGPDDFFCIITNNGEIAVFQGSDPDSATTWALVGIYDVGKPIGRRCMVRMSGDLAIITQDGIVSGQAISRFDRAAIQKATITGKIQTLFSQYAQSYFGNFGWQAVVYPRSRYMVCNVPQIENGTSVQLVMNTVTGAWCEFNGMDAGCWGVANDQLYFGGIHGTIFIAETGFLDDGDPLEWRLRTAWQMPGGSTNKQFTAVRPTMITGGGVEFGIHVDVDFNDTPPSGVVPSPVQSGMIWPWTWPGTWGGSQFLDARWQTVGAIGTWVSVDMAGVVNGASCQIQAFNLMAKIGGPF